MLLDAQNVTAGYGDRDILIDISLTVAAGRFVGLIGPNGGGKSTLLRVLSQALAPRRGVVWLAGKELRTWKPRELARTLAFVPQSEIAAFDFTVRDIVRMGRHAYHTGWRGETLDDEAIVEAALRDADVHELADRVVTELSGGEHRRVLLARALAQQTPLLLLDEPTANLDITHAVDLMARTRRLCRERGVGALAALHDLNAAAEFCDRLILLANGSILADGPPVSVLTPQNLRVAYGATARIGRNPATGRPTILALQTGNDVLQKRRIRSLVPHSRASNAAQTSVSRQHRRATGQTVSVTPPEGEE